MVTSALVVVKNPTLAAGSEVGIKMADGGVEQGSLCIPWLLMDCSSLLCVCTSPPSQCCLSRSCTQLGSSSTLQSWQSSASPARSRGTGVTAGIWGAEAKRQLQLQKAPGLGRMPAVLKCRAACGLSLSGIIGFW